MKKLNFLLLLIGLMMIMFSSCQKENVISNSNGSNLQSSSFIDDINNFKPETEKIAYLYHGFQERLNAIPLNNQTFLKGDPIFQDTTVDIGIWLIETGLNNEYGFKNDSIVYERKSVRYYDLDIIGYDEHQVPIIPGEQLVLIYSDMEDYIEESALVDSLFWMCVVELKSVRQNDLTISVLPFTGELLHLNGVLPPGTDPTPFPTGTLIYSCEYYGQGIAPLFNQIQWRISGGNFYTQTDYIWVQVSYFGKSWNDNPYDPDERFWAGTSTYELLYTADCNYYLFAQKDIVDGINPNPENPNRIIGTFLMDFYEPPWPVQGMTAWHYSTFCIYEKVYIGSGNPN